MTKKLFLFLLLICSFTSAQTSVPISDLRMNNSGGLPVGLGNTYTVTGIVTSSNQFGSAGPGTIQDSSAGISVYGIGFVSQVAIGDSVTITGKLDQFNGLTQINFNLGGTALVNHGAGIIPEPEVVTIDQIKNQAWDGFEAIEGKLIRINNLKITGTGNFSGGSSGQNYPISDPTGTLEIRIDESVNIVGTSIPSDTVDIIGVLGQFDSSAPHSTGYQLYPRFIEDIISDDRPLILTPVFAANVDTSSFTIYFNTAKNGNSQVKYGLTPQLELDSVIIETDTTAHMVPVTGLDQGTLYYYRAYSTNQAGTSESDLRSVTTASTDTTIGKINVYFNFSVDTSIALPGNNAMGNVNFEEKLLERINNAVYSIDLALYSFDLPDVADALVLAKNRGVKVRVAYDSRNTQSSMQTLINNGILISKRPNATSSFPGIMHNKFFIFDARDTIITNDWVWTGSWNVTNLELGWKNNVIEINDPTVAMAYLVEFEEMWGSNNDTPDPSVAKFGNMKSDNTPHSFTVGGRPLKVYFGPSDGTTSQIINSVQSIDHSMYFAIFTFTRNDINSAMNTKYNSGVTDIRGILDQTNDPSSQWNNLNNYAEMFPNQSPTLHHKYALFDPQFPESDPTVITGSHNWSNAAENSNDENSVFIYDELIANQYLQEFKKRYNEVGGTGIFITPVSTGEDRITEFDYQLFQNYPNPFNPMTTIRVSIPFTQNIELKIFDTLGREVKTLYQGIAPEGIMAIDFNAEGLSSGVYIYRIVSESFTASKKLMLMK
jgi:phosphatidylserine/phosphatidylglycerophosphate/cardiolipin synthase-like enzyme